LLRSGWFRAYSRCEREYVHLRRGWSRMFTRRVLAVMLVVGALLLTCCIGCGPKPPCPVPPEEVRQAQAETEQVQGDLAGAETEREQLQKELREKEANLQQLRGKPDELKKELDTLKKGSGR
jgi:septal ring factor EnvC (AmiA/AmiB activator)